MSGPGKWWGSADEISMSRAGKMVARDIGVFVRKSLASTSSERNSNRCFANSLRGFDYGGELTQKSVTSALFTRCRTGNTKDGLCDQRESSRSFSVVRMCPLFTRGLDSPHIQAHSELPVESSDPVTEHIMSVPHLVSSRDDRIPANGRCAGCRAPGEVQLDLDQNARGNTRNSVPTITKYSASYCQYHQVSPQSPTKTQKCSVGWESIHRWWSTKISMTHYKVEP